MAGSTLLLVERVIDDLRLDAAVIIVSKGAGTDRDACEEAEVFNSFHGALT